MNFEIYPFEKLSELLNDITPNHNYKPLTLTIGEPQFETPQIIQQTLKENTNFLNKYPKSAGEHLLREAIIKFVNNRFNVLLKNEEIIPTFGTREVLFNFPQFLLFDKKEPIMAFPNPFYQIYEGAAIASRAKVIYLNLTKENSFKPLIDEKELKKCNLVILNFPNNPTASTISLNELVNWVKLALKYDFILLNDECYSEIYMDEKPISLLEASIKAGNGDFKNIFVLNSISKRSSAPGLRSGFIAGDSRILKDYLKYRTYIGCASPLPLQLASAIAWGDEEHTLSIREEYRENLKLASEILGVKIPKATFYVWLEVGDDLEFTKKLYKEKNLKVLPGRYLGRDGLGEGYVRIALVDTKENVKEALNRIKQLKE